jgi:hypothetical protein
MDIVTRAISQHATETMQHHYSTVAADEKRRAIAKVTELAGARKALAGGRQAQVGMVHSRKRKAARPWARRALFPCLSCRREVLTLRPLPEGQGDDKRL